MVSIYGVLEKWAAKTEATPLAEGEVAPRPDTGKVETKRYYFYQADTKNSIDFMNLNKILNDKDDQNRAETVNLLKGGNTSSATKSADYFKWSAVAVRTNRYDPDRKTFAVYVCRLNAFGQKQPGSEQVLPDTVPVRKETFEEDHTLFHDVRGNTDIVQLDTSGESIYVNSEAPSDLGQRLVKNAAWRGLKYEDFVKDTFGKYRIWVMNVNQLLQPDHEESKTDMLKGGRGNYEGGNEAFEREVPPDARGEAPEEQEATPGEAPAAKPKEAPAPAFKPGTEPVKPTKGQMVDEGDSALKTAYDLKEAARRVVAAITSATPGSMSTSQQRNQRTPTVPISADPKINQTSAKMLQDLANMQKKMQNVQQTVMRQQGTSTTTSTGTMGPKA
jgi:hypothetical protein